MESVKDYFVTICNLFLSFVGYTLEPVCVHEEQKRKIEVPLGQRKRIKSSVEGKAFVAAKTWNLKPEIKFAEDCPTPINIAKKKVIAPSESLKEINNDEDKKVISPTKSIDEGICESTNGEAGESFEEAQDALVFVSKVNVKTTTFSSETDSCKDSEINLTKETSNSKIDDGPTLLDETEPSKETSIAKTAEASTLVDKTEVAKETPNAKIDEGSTLMDKTNIPDASASTDKGAGGKGGEKENEGFEESSDKGEMNKQSGQKGKNRRHGGKGKKQKKAL